MSTPSPTKEELKCQDLFRKNVSIGKGMCPIVWDGFSCWNYTTLGETAFGPCPVLKGSDASLMSLRKCGMNGKWIGRFGEDSEKGWTNYTPCFTPEIRDIMRRLGSEDKAQTKLYIAWITRILEFIGLSLSLTALIVSLLIFCKFRSLRNRRTRLHRHLFIAMLIQVAIRLTLYIDQVVTRVNGKFPSETSSQKSIDHETMRGIDNTPILCEASYILLEYSRTCMFFWMFVEGLYLHNMITVTVFEEKLSSKIYLIVGWVIPIPLTLAWTLATAMNYGNATCWFGYNFTIYFWILEGPRLGILMVNLAFLLNVLRVLVTKLRRSHSSEIDQIRKAVKAALLLLPLLGLINLLNMLHAPLEKSAWVFGAWSYSTHLLTSSQGLLLACLYCFSNGEVQSALKKYFQVKVRGRNKIRFPRTSARMSVPNNTIVAQTDSQHPRFHCVGITSPGGQPSEKLVPSPIPAMHSDKLAQMGTECGYKELETSHNNELDFGSEEVTPNDLRTTLETQETSLIIHSEVAMEKLNGFRFVRFSRRSKNAHSESSECNGESIRNVELNGNEKADEKIIMATKNTSSSKRDQEIMDMVIPLTSHEAPELNTLN